MKETPTTIEPVSTERPTLTNVDAVLATTAQSFQDWNDERYEDDGNYGGHISARMCRFWVFLENDR